MFIQVESREGSPLMYIHRIYYRCFLPQVKCILLAVEIVGDNTNLDNNNRGKITQGIIIK